MARRSVRPTPVGQPDGTNQDEFEFLQIQAETYEGLLPHPEILKGYEEIAPGSAIRVFDMTEKEAAHRQELELMASLREDDKSAAAAKRHLLREIGVSLSILGALFCFLATIGSGTYLVAIDKDIAGIPALITAVAIVVASFVTARRKVKKEIQKQDSSTSDPGIPPSPKS